MENKYCEQCIIDRDKEKCSCECHTSPKEEIVNDWESVSPEYLVNDFIKSIQGTTAEWIIGRLETFLPSLLSSTEKRMAKEICEILKDKQNLVCSCATKECPRLGVIINLIKSKYE